MKIIAERKEEMKKIAILAVLAVVFLVSGREALAYWKPVIGTVVYDPAPIFEEITIK